MWGVAPRRRAGRTAVPTHVCGDEISTMLRLAHHLVPSRLIGRRRALLTTLASPTREVVGTALHTGVTSSVRLCPSNEGIQFVRTDLPGKPSIAADVSEVASTVLSTTIGHGEAQVSTVEHLMAALCGMGVRNCRVEVNATELPILDGSAAEWVAAIREAGLAPTAAAGRTDARGACTRYQHAPVRATRVVLVEEGDSWAIALPALSPRLTVGIDFPSHASIGRQWASWAPDEMGCGSAFERGAATITDAFAIDVAPARTFALAEQLDALSERGLIRGGSLENALVCDASGWLNPSPLRFANEPARHKLLDLMGDLALLGGTLPLAHVVAFRAGHRLHVALAEAIAADAAASTAAGSTAGGGDYSWISDAVVSARRAA